uniref:Uncharacterized protein n=1 Tax=Hyaloperonospora arabidopsidis (strain Emoy2) TaxID=559515 RepID=M4BA36_HYAAE
MSTAVVTTDLALASSPSSVRSPTLEGAMRGGLTTQATIFPKREVSGLGYECGGGSRRDSLTNTRRWGWWDSQKTNSRRTRSTNTLSVLSERLEFTKILSESKVESLHSRCGRGWGSRR